MAVLAKVVSVWLLIASASYVFCLPKREVMNKVGHEVDVTTPNPNNQTHTGANEDGLSEDDVVTAMTNPQNQTMTAQTGNAEVEQ
ncbi:hypothetical protein AALO_G00239360 [Alosa alosa]|uniref:Secreted protein n=1 Tax=Alosa alosa TaxID=278164 RepID=A0AAV6FWY4_9TELE|nr:hypothetical protein AALO_G00239360 [Alosa alosa]